MTCRIGTVRFKPEAFPVDRHRDESKGWPCPYCWERMEGTRYPTWDHLVPLAAGGPDNNGNKIPVCRPCNERKGHLSLPMFVGKLMAIGDPHYVAAKAFLEWLIDIAGRSPAFEAQCYAEIGAGFSHYSQRRDRFLGVVRPMQETVYVHEVLSGLGVPRTHWSYDPPGHVKVLIGSLPERFPLLSAERLKHEVLSHPRAKFLKRGRVT